MKKALIEAGNLQDFVQRVFIPEHCKSRNYAGNFLATLKWLRRFLRRPPLLSDMSRATLTDFLADAELMGASTARCNTFRRSFVAIWNCAEEHGRDVPECDVPPPGRMQKLPLPEGKPGTLPWFFFERYKPEQIPECSPQWDCCYHAMFRHMRSLFGKDLRLKELSSRRLASYLEYLKGCGRALQTVKKHRTLVLALWRYANLQGLAPRVPSFPRLKIPREQPDAWSIDEVVKIISAAGRLQRQPIGGVPANKLWRAMLLVAYYTAIRRSSLWRIRPQDVDLAAGTLYIPAAHMKNRRGQRFKLGEDAIQAIREIYDPTRDRLFPVPLKSGNSRHIYAQFNAILQMAEVEKGTRNKLSCFHKMRRTSVTHTAVKAGLPAAIALAGHSGPDVNARYIDPSYLPQHDATAWLPPVGASLPAKRKDGVE